MGRSRHSKISERLCRLSTACRPPTGHAPIRLGIDPWGRRISCATGDRCRYGGDCPCHRRLMHRPGGRTAAELERLRRIRNMLFQGYPIARPERAAWPGRGSTLFDQLRLAVTGGWPVSGRRIECRHHCRRSARIAPTLVLRASARFTGFFTTATASVSRSAGNATAMSASLISADGWAATMSRGASIDGGVGSVDGAMASGCSRAGRIA